MSQAGMDQLGKGFFPSPLNKWQLLAGQSMGWDVILFSLGQFKGKWEQTIAPKMTWKISSATPEGQQGKGMAERKGRNCGFFFFFYCLDFHSHCLLSSEEEVCANTQATVGNVAFAYWTQSELFQPAHMKSARQSWTLIPWQHKD